MAQWQVISSILAHKESHRKNTCQCECRKLGVGVCKGALISTCDPYRILCDLCYFELTKMKGIRKYEICRYPSNVPSCPSSAEN
ncbi:hypothetical protein AAE478_008940 [Parahypoxylon ruwenzoriense]